MNRTSAQIRMKKRKEQRVVREMIDLYCRHQHPGQRRNGDLCPVCNELAEYARVRIENCPFMTTKTFCSQCKVHCYSDDMRKKIRVVMRYAGPRMLFYHPLMCCWHVMTTIGNKYALRKES